MLYAIPFFDFNIPKIICSGRIEAFPSSRTISSAVINIFKALGVNIICLSPNSACLEETSCNLDAKISALIPNSDKVFDNSDSVSSNIDCIICSEPRIS